MPDARREWLKTLSGDESLQKTVGAELYAQLKLPAGMDRVATTSTFITLIQMPDSVTGKLAGQGFRKSAGTRSRTSSAVGGDDAQVHGCETGEAATWASGDGKRVRITLAKAGLCENRLQKVPCAHVDDPTHSKWLVPER